MLLVLLVLTALVASAQPIRFYEGDELSSSHITSICQDRQGYIWIGTEYGLNKFDGVRFIRYYHDRTNARSLCDNIIRKVLPDPQRGLWLLTNQGMQYYDPLTDSFETVSQENGTLSYIYDIAIAPDGKIWLSNESSGLMSVDRSQMKAVAELSVNKKLDKRPVSRIFIDSRLRMWISYTDKGLLMIDAKSGKTRYYDERDLLDVRATGIVENQKHQIFVASYTHILQLNESSLNLQPMVEIPLAYSARGLYLDSNDHLMLGSMGRGIFQVDMEERELVSVYETALAKQQLKEQKVTAYCADRNGNAWLGCYQRGLVYVSNTPQPFHSLSLGEMSFNNGHRLCAVYTDRQGHILVGQELGGLKEITPEGDVRNHYLCSTTTIAAYEDREGRLWAGTYRLGACRLSTDRKTETWIPQLDKKRVKSFAEDRQGNIYLAVFNDGLHSYTAEGLEERTLCGGKMELHNKYLTSLLTDHQGRIWIGHYYGIDVYNPAKDRLEDIPVDTILRKSIVYALAQTRDSTIWIGTNQGLFAYDKQGRYTAYTVHDGLPSDNICGIVEDRHGNLWLSTYYGMSCLNRETGQFANYYKGKGLTFTAFERGLYCRSSYGQVLFGGDHALVYFSPDKMVANDFIQGITLTGMIVNNQSVNITDSREIELSYQDNTFTLLFSSMDFREPQDVYYEYHFVDETGDVWHRTTAGMSEITFARLPYGRHRLQVRACDNGTCSPVMTLTIRILPPWYRTWWAYTLYILVLAGLALFVWHYWRKKEAAETNEEKIRFFVDISHELRSPLTLIKSPLDQLLKVSNDPTQMRALRNIERNTNRLLTLTNQILSIRKIEKGQMQMHFAETRLGDFISDICHDYDYQVERRQLTLTFNNEAPDMMVWIDRDHFDKVVTNLLGNAMKYVSDGGEIQVTLRQTADNKAELTVSDNGPGIDEAQLRKIFQRFYQTSVRPSGGQMSYGIGLNLTQKFIALHKGVITARNRTDSHGAEFVVLLPLGNSHLPKDQLLDQPLNVERRPDDSNTDANYGLASDDKAPRRVRRKTSYRIAVVDDDEDIRNFLQTELGESYHVAVYPDGKKALEGVVDTVPDLVVSDVVMPVMDGIELLKRLKASTTTSHIPVILLTTKTEHEARIEGLEEGADAYIDKPFNLEELETRIASLIANRMRIKGKFSGMQEQEDTVRKIELKGNDAALMEKIMKAVNERLDDSDFNVEALADEVGLSRVQLHRRMKELTGITVGEFIRNLRLQQAAKLLASGDTTVAQVTYAVGFANPTHFATAFKKHFGVTPSEYLLKHQRTE